MCADRYISRWFSHWRGPYHCFSLCIRTSSWVCDCTMSCLRLSTERKGWDNGEKEEKDRAHWNDYWISVLLMSVLNSERQSMKASMNKLTLSLPNYWKETLIIDLKKERRKEKLMEWVHSHFKVGGKKSCKHMENIENMFWLGMSLRDSPMISSLSMDWDDNCSRFQWRFTNCEQYRSCYLNVEMKSIDNWKSSLRILARKHRKYYRIQWRYLPFWKGNSWWNRRKERNNLSKWKGGSLLKDSVAREKCSLYSVTRKTEGDLYLKVEERWWTAQINNECVEKIQKIQDEE